MADPIDRYRTLKLKESLSNPSLYTLACKELSYILKNAYSKSPKNLQLLIFQETIHAFSLLSEVQTQSAISAANFLLQSAEYAFPKQKRALAVAEHKHAVVATKRKSKTTKEEEEACLLLRVPNRKTKKKPFNMCVQFDSQRIYDTLLQVLMDPTGLDLISEDILLHIFSFLDLHSLVNASAVCRSWNAVAGNNRLWKLLYTVFVSRCENIRKDCGCFYGVTSNEDKKFLSLDEFDTGANTDWRHEFKTAFRETSFSKFKSYRGYCRVCCSVVWLNSNKCPEKNNSKNGENHLISPISRQHIVDYILTSSISDSSSDSDSDSENSSVFRLWAYTRRIVQ